MDWPPTDREMLIRIDENVKHLKENFATTVEKVDKINGDYVSKKSFGAWIAILVAVFAGVPEWIGLYRKG